MSELLTCKICGSKGVSYACNLYHKGTTLRCWCVECSADPEYSSVPYMEHKMAVFGKDQEEAEKRWNEVNK